MARATRPSRPSTESPTPSTPGSTAESTSPSNQSPAPASTTATATATIRKTTSKKRKRAGGNSTSNSAMNGSATHRSAGPQSRLSENQKKLNHVNAEKDRRKEILDRMTTICDELVPGATGLAKSEETALKMAYEHLRSLLLRKKELVEEIEGRGDAAPDEELDMIKALEHMIEDSEVEEGEGEGEEGDEENRMDRQSVDDVADGDDWEHDDGVPERDRDRSTDQGFEIDGSDDSAGVALIKMANGH